MPEVGEVRRAKDAGYRGWARYQWHACEGCGKERWVQYNQLLAGRHQSCTVCANRKRGGPKGQANRNWKGGRHIGKRGYVLVYVLEDDPLASMSTKNHYVLEHRLVMAKSLGRVLHNWEAVHHKNGIRDDNRIANLELTLRSQHSTDHNKGYQDGFRKGFTDGRSTKIRELQARIATLETQASTVN